MKYLLFASLLMLAIGCNSSKEKTSSVDTMNGVDITSPGDTTGVTRPDGYAPPNTATDTSQKTKDSLNAAKH